VLRLQHRADGWYLVGRVGDEMNQHFFQPGKPSQKSFRAERRRQSQALKRLTLQQFP
jgi:hypothetical protein